MAFLTLGRRRQVARLPLSPDERRFALGTRSVADLIAPAAIEVARDRLRIDHQYARTLAVTGYPRTVEAGWLTPLIDFEEPLEISTHVHPLETSQMVSSLSHKLVQLHSSRLFEARGGRLSNPEREVAYEDAERLRDALQRGDEKVFSVSIYILVRANTLPALDDLTRRVESTLDGMLARSRIAIFEQDGGFHSCLPEGQNRLHVYRNLDTSSLATAFPFASSTLTMQRGVLYGIARHNHSPVIVDPFDPSLENANMVVFAKSGAGKSYFTKLTALRCLLLDIDFMVIDPEDEYRTICDAVGGQYIRLASASIQHLNPFDLSPGATRHATGAHAAPPSAGHARPHASSAAPDSAALSDLAGEDEALDVLAEQVAGLLGLLEVMLAEPGQPLSAVERATLDRALYQTYAAAAITPHPETHTQPPPLLRDLHSSLAAAPGDVAMSLATRLQRYVEGSFAGLFSAPTNVALDRRFVVFNIQALEPAMRPLGIHLVTNFVWNQVRRSRRPRLLIIDEAWSLLQYPEGGAFLASMARRARKYYLGLVTITQDVTDFLGADHGRTVLANASVKLLMKQDSTTIGPVVAAFQLSLEERQFLLAAGKGEGLFFARGSHVAIKIEASPAEHRLATTAPRELVAQTAPSAQPIQVGAGIGPSRRRRRLASPTEDV